MRPAALRASGRDPLANLALEEALLEGPRGEDPLLLFYVNDPCVVVGRNQNPWAEVSPRCPFPVLRRASGGGTVYHDAGNLNWSFIVPRSSHDPGAELAAVAGALRELGLECSPGRRGGLFARAAGRGDVKISGTARRFAATRVMHHGTLLVDADLGALSASLGGIAARDSRAVPSSPAAAANLAELVPGAGLEPVLALLARSLGSGDPSPAEEAADPTLAASIADRLASWEWTWGSTPAFALSVGERGSESAIEVRSGIVASIVGPGFRSLAQLVGTKFDYRVPERASAILGAAGRSIG